MADYYLYLLDSKASIIKRVDLAGHPDDDHARDAAAAHPHAGGMELWERGRLVERFGSFEASIHGVRSNPGEPLRAVYDLDRDLRFISANDVALEYWGRTLPDIEGQNLADAFPYAVGSKPYQAHLQTLRRRQPFHCVVRSPVLEEAIDLQIYPHREGLRVSFLKVRQSQAKTESVAA